MNYNVSKFRAKHNGRPLLFFLFLFIPLLQLSLFTASAQTEALNEKVTLNQSNGTMLDMIRELDRQSSFSFSYSQAQLEVIKVSSLSLNKVSLSEALKVLETRYKMEFSVLQKVISVKPPKRETKSQNSPNASAGQGPGTIKGRIVEFETSQPLPGASVYIVELKKGTQSDNDGYYRFTDIPGGKYTIQVSYISYTTEKLSITAHPGKETSYNVKMQGSNALQEVVVSSIRKSRAPVAHTTERQVLEEVKSASIVVSAISSEQISKSADRNAAEAVQKVAGVTIADDKFVVVRGLNQRYNLTYLNDNVAPSTEIYSRAFALDLIPSRIIDRIMVYKSVGPESLADATGGVIKIYTKDATTVKHFDVEFQLGVRPGTTFNNNFLTYQGGKLDFLGIDDGTRKLPSSMPGYDQLKLAQMPPSDYAKTFNPTLTYQRTTAMPNMQITANYYNAFRIGGKTLSSLTSLSYKNEALKVQATRQEGYPEIAWSSTDKRGSEDRNLQTAQLNLLQNFTLKLRDSSTLSFKNFVLQQGQDATIIRYSQSYGSLVGANSMNKDNILSFNQRFLYAGNLGGTHYSHAGKHKLQWNAGYTFSRQSTPDQRVIRLTTPLYANAIGDTTLQWRGRGQNLEFADSYDPTPSKLGMISRLWMRNSEGNYNAAADYTYKWKPWLSFRAGTFQQWKERQLYRRIYTVHEGDVTNPDNIYFQPGTGHYLDPLLVRFREQDLANVWSGAYLSDDYIGLRVFDRTSGSDSYIGTEQNNSGYIAANFTPLSRLFEVYGGLRYEYNRQRIGAAIPKPANNPEDVNTPIYINNPMKTWLPSVNASWRPNESWVIRAAAGKTVNRTEFREVAPYQELDFQNNIVISGNPQLKSATINNYDFRVEFYPGKNAKGEILSAGLFYKELKNPIERINTSNRVLNDFPSVSYQNASSATIRGVELEINKKLDFIPGNFFRNLSFIGNLSLIKSETVNDTTNNASLTLVTGKRPLQGQAPYIVNAGLYYDNAAWGTKLAVIYNTSGQSIYAAGRGYRLNQFIDGPEFRGSLIELPRHLLDVSVTQRIVKSLQAKLSVQNLLDQSVRVAEDFNFSNKYEPLHDTDELDKYGKKRKDGDNISSQFSPGRYFVFNLSYSF